LTPEALNEDIHSHRVGDSVLLLGVGYVVRGQTAKQEVVMEMEISKNGSVVGKPTMRVTDGSTATIHLNDGTEVKVTAKVIPR